MNSVVQRKTESPDGSSKPTSQIKYMVRPITIWEEIASFFQKDRYNLTIDLKSVSKSLEDLWLHLQKKMISNYDYHSAYLHHASQGVFTIVDNSLTFNYNP